jgi:hypothetical protein
MKMDATLRPQSVHQLQKALRPSENGVPAPAVQTKLLSKFMFFLRGGKRSKGISDIRTTHEVAHREKKNREKLSSAGTKSSARDKGDKGDKG